MENLKARFEALPKSEQERILDENRYVVVCDNWWQDVYDQFMIELTEAGYGVDVRHGRVAMYFNGFSSQGDGACFEGYVADFDKVAKDYPALLKAEYTDRFLRWHSRGNYSHENTLEFNEHFDIRNEFDREDHPLRWHAREDEIREVENLWVKFVEDTEKRVKDLCRDLYKRLNQEHDWLTEDEQVLDSLIANDQLEEELNEQESA